MAFITETMENIRGVVARAGLREVRKAEERSQFWQDVNQWRRERDVRKFIGEGASDRVVALRLATMEHERESRKLRRHSANE